MVTSDEMTRLRAGLRDDILLVIDAAYAEYVTRNDYTPGVELVDAGDNVVMTRTFSKIYAMGGVRLGWAYCPEAVADVLNRIRPPFNVTSGAQAAGIAAVNDVEFLTRSRDHNTAWLPWLSGRLGEMGLDVVPSTGNFVLVRFPESGPHTADAAMAFLTSQGIIPRGTGSAGIPEGIRITIGLEEEMRATVDVISKFLENNVSDLMFDRVAFIGIGLIGSSIARVMRRDNLASTIIACARTDETLDAAKRLNIADETTKDIAGQFETRI